MKPKVLNIKRLLDFRNAKISTILFKKRTPILKALLLFVPFVILYSSSCLPTPSSNTQGPTLPLIVTIRGASSTIFDTKCDLEVKYQIELLDDEGEAEEILGSINGVDETIPYDNEPSFIPGTQGTQGVWTCFYQRTYSDLKILRKNGSWSTKYRVTVSSGIWSSSCEIDFYSHTNPDISYYFIRFNVNSDQCTSAGSGG